MIETRTALDNVDAIAATAGLDALFIGPYDLATNLSGGTAQDIAAPEVERAIDRIRDAAVKAGKIPAIYCRDPARAKKMQPRGFKFMAVASDLGLVRDGAAAILKALNR
jgi:4-hydroxy-2-oxoheptanedioate aldolase